MFKILTLIFIALQIMSMIVVMLVLTVVLTHAQDKKLFTCDHTTNSKTRFDNVRITPPVKIRAWNGKLLEVTYEDRLGVYAESFEADRESIIDFTKYEGKWMWIMYCEKDRHLYLVTPVLPKQLSK